MRADAETGRPTRQSLYRAFDGFFVAGKIDCAKNGFTTIQQVQLSARPHDRGDYAIP